MMGPERGRGMQWEQSWSRSGQRQGPQCVGSTAAIGVTASLELAAGIYMYAVGAGARTQYLSARQAKNSRTHN